MLWEYDVLNRHGGFQRLDTKGEVHNAARYEHILHNTIQLLPQLRRQLGGPMAWDSEGDDRCVCLGDASWLIGVCPLSCYSGWWWWWWCLTYYLVFSLRSVSFSRILPRQLCASACMPLSYLAAACITTVSRGRAWRGRKKASSTFFFLFFFSFFFFYDYVYLVDMYYSFTSCEISNGVS